jgi:hypothetical protein
MSEGGCDFRLGQEGIHIIEPFMEIQRISLSEDDFILLMKEDYPLFSSFSEGAREQMLNASKRRILFIFPELGLDLSSFS